MISPSVVGGRGITLITHSKERVDLVNDSLDFVTRKVHGIGWLLPPLTNLSFVTLSYALLPRLDYSD